MPPSPLKRSLADQREGARPRAPRCRPSLKQSGGLYRGQGRYADAELLYKRSLAIWEKVLGPSTLMRLSLNNLALLYDARAAMPMPSRSTNAAWRSGRRRHGLAVPQIPPTSLNNLAGRYISQPGALHADAAEPLQAQPAIRRKALGPSTLMSPRASTILADSCMHAVQGRFAEY